MSKQSNGNKEMKEYIYTFNPALLGLVSVYEIHRGNSGRKCGETLIAQSTPCGEKPRTVAMSLIDGIVNVNYTLKKGKF